MEKTNTVVIVKKMVVFLLFLPCVANLMIGYHIVAVITAMTAFCQEPTIQARISNITIPIKVDIFGPFDHSGQPPVFLPVFQLQVNFLFPGRSWSG